MYRRSASAVASARRPCDRPRGGLARVLSIAVALLGLSAAASVADELPVRDPTRPASVAGTPLGPAMHRDSLLLASTSVSAGSASAVVNGEVVTVGSRIGGAVVTAIEPRRVTLKRGSEAIVLQLLTPPVKRAVKESS